MKKSHLVKGLCVALAGMMIFSLGGCKKKSNSVAAEAKKNAKDAVFHKDKEFSPDFTATNGKTKGDKFILMRTDGGTFQYAIGGMDGSLSASVNVSLTSENCYVSSQCVDLGPDGSVYFIDNLSDYQNNEFSNSLVHISADGKELARTDLGEATVFGMVCMNDGSVVVRYESELQIYDADCNKKKSIPNTNASQNWSDIVVNGNDLLLFMTGGENGISVHKVDIANGTIGASIPYSPKQGTVTSGDGYDFYLISTGNGVSGVNLSQNSITDVFNFMDSDLQDTDSLTVRMFDAEHALVLTDSTVENPYVAVFKKVPPSEIPDKEYLTLGGFYISSDTKKIISKFNSENSKYKIRVIDYSEYNTADNNYEGGNKVFQGDAATGNIPDIIMTDSLPNVEAYINKNMFTDLTPLMEKAGLNKSDYLENIIAAGSKDDKLYILVPFYYIQGFVMKKEYVNANNSISIDDYMQLEKKFNIAGKSMYYLPKSSIIEYALSYNTSDYLDVKTGKCNFNSDDFKKVLTLANEFPNDADLEKTFAGTEYLGAFARDEMLITPLGMGSFRETYRQEQNVFGEEAAFIGFPNADGDSKPVIAPSIAVAISSKSSNKEGAFEFVKMLLSEDFQTEIDNGVSGNKGLPVLKTAFEAMGETAKEPFARKNESGEWEPVDPEFNVYEIGGKQFTYKEITQEHLDYLKGVAKSATELRFKEAKILNLINEEAAAYFAGQKSVDDVTNIIQSRVSIYVKENQ